MFQKELIKHKYLSYAIAIVRYAEAQNETELRGNKNLGTSIVYASLLYDTGHPHSNIQS